MEIENIYREKFSELDLPVTKPPENIQKCIDNVIKNENFIKHVVTFKEIPVDGGNYLAQLYEVSIKGVTTKGDKELEIFVKNVVPVSESVQFFCINDVYNRECFFYKDLAKNFALLEQEANVPLDERYKCARGYNESTTEVILLENLAKKGFRTRDRMEMIPLKFFELSIHQLAKIHAMTFIIEQKMPELFKQIQAKKHPIAFNDSWFEFMRNLSKLTVKDLRPDIKKKAQDMISDLLEEFKEYFEDDSLLVLCHGDFRASNILMREEEGEIQETIPVDFQIIHYGNPANDLLYFIYGCNDKQFRKRHSRDLINLYYDSTRRYLRYFDIDISQVYPREKLDLALKNRKAFGSVMALTYYTFFYAPKDNAPKIEDADKIDELEISLDVKIIKRIEEIVEDLSKADLFRLKASVWG